MPAAISDVLNSAWEVLWRTSGEGNEEVLEPRNLGYGVIPSYWKRPIPSESIGSSRRGCKNPMGGKTGGKDESSSGFGECYLGLERIRLRSGWDSLCPVIGPHERLTLQPLRIGSPTNSFGSWRILFEEELWLIRFHVLRSSSKKMAYEKAVSVLTQV